MYSLAGATFVRKIGDGTMGSIYGLLGDLHQINKCLMYLLPFGSCYSLGVKSLAPGHLSVGNERGAFIVLEYYTSV